MIKNYLGKSIESTYIKMSPIEHILKKPGMYVGDLDFRTEPQLVYNNNIIIMKDISWSPGLYKIVDELIVNSYDQTIRDNTMTMIKVNITPDSFTIFNDGIGIDVVKHKEHNIYIPELIFANLLTSTNYSDEERITGGTHGLGAKLSAIFSKKFIIEVWDKTRQLYYSQTFENNLSIIRKPIIEKNKNMEIKGGVKITMYPDFMKFSTTEFSQDMIELYHKRVVDLIALVNSNVKIFLNDINLETSSFENYLKLFPSDEEWIVGSCIKNPLWKFAIRFNNNSPLSNISFVNGIYTNRGGKHMEYIIDLLVEKFKKILKNNNITKKLINDHLTICLKCSILNPTFNSQSKEELNTPISKFGFECNIANTFWDNIPLSIIERLKEIISLQDKKILISSDGSKKSKIKNIPKLDDANFAGTKKSIECVLILTEGDSAKATAISGISAIQNGRNFYGVYPLRGKLLNVREASSNTIANNNEIVELKKILGLKTNFIYNNDNIKELRYGSIMIMTDADEDGSHIKGLIINFFDYFFPSLIAIEGFIKILVTPLIKATNLKSDQVINFANNRAYMLWKTNNNSNMYKIKYYKGLGTSTSKEAGEYFQNIKQNTITLLDSGKDTSDILLAFAKDKVMERKQWLNDYDPTKILQLEPPQNITIKQFIHMELIHFSNYDNIRSIPSITDGFKPSQRKVLYGCFKRNLISEMKIAQLAASVAEVSSYHHGEQSLVATIINMAQNFVGANNMNLLIPMGQLGTRLMGGKDHSSARYIYTYLEKYVKCIYNKDDMELLESNEDDGYMIEPRYYLPIIPMILINGCEGIGTGFSTFIPNFNPIDIILWLQNKLNNKKVPKLIPWYKNFKGNIIQYDNSTYISSGIMTLTDNMIEITELPLKMWTNDYKEFLEQLIYENKDSLFKSYVNMSSDTNVHFILKYKEDSKDEIMNLYNTTSDNLNMLYKYLHLYKTIKISNMNLYTHNNIIKTYKSPEEILEDFFSWRIVFYEKRKVLLIQKLKDTIILYNNMIQFINLVNKNNKLFTLDSNDIISLLKTNKITTHNDSYDYLLNLTFNQLTKTNLEKLEGKVKDAKNTMKSIEMKTINMMWLDDIEELKKLI